MCPFSLAATWPEKTTGLLLQLSSLIKAAFLLPSKHMTSWGEATLLPLQPLVRELCLLPPPPPQQHRRLSIWGACPLWLRRHGNTPATHAVLPRRAAQQATPTTWLQSTNTKHGELPVLTKHHRHFQPLQAPAVIP